MARRLDPILARLHSLHPQLIDLSLDRLQRLLVQLGHPERRLPPVLHVAGTNGKGSTCAFLRAIAEAAGWRVHVYTSPHLVRLNERYRVAEALVTDAALADAMEAVEQVNAGAPITVFEVMTAAAFVLFAGTPADLCILEVGLGGRGDATNVITPAACAITAISMDHKEMLGDTLALIAAEKAGILKPGVPAVTGGAAARGAGGAAGGRPVAGARAGLDDRAGWGRSALCGCAGHAGPAAPRAAGRAPGGQCRKSRSRPCGRRGCGCPRRRSPGFRRRLGRRGFSG